MKICSLYGAGFYYIPGTDICLKVGGWTRAEYAYGDNGNMTWGPFNGNVNNRGTSNSTWRARGYITVDARNQTAYGTVRSYMAIGLSTSDIGLNTAANTFSANRAFIQWAGFTFGQAQSFYDFYNVPATSYWGSFPASDTGDPGWMVASYTAQFGGGFSATISAEQRRMTQIIGQGAAGGAAPVFGSINAVPAAAAAFPGGYGGFNSPDIVANLRIDQAWGSAQIMGALHQVNGGYYTAALEPSGGPSNTWGYAVGAGIKLNAPMIGAGDYFQAQVNWAEGASRYTNATTNSNWYNLQGSSAGFGILSDGVYGGAGATATSLNLTKTWGFNAAYEHFWNPAWRTSVYGGYSAVRYNGQANAILCSAMGAVNGAGAGILATANAGCDNNWSTWFVGSRTQWNVTKDFYMGLDVMYQRLSSAQTANGLVPGTVIPATTGTAPQAVADRSNVMFRFRVHRDFMP